MSVNSINETASTYQNYSSYVSTASKKTEDTVSSKESSGVVYESSDISKMSASDRANLVEQLKADQESRQSQLTNLVKDMISKQGQTYGQANDIWKFLASGDFTVDAQTKADAQEAISEDGYWGVKQTSQRIFDFAMSLSGGDEEKMKQMQEAVEKGFKLATSAWGKELPGISSDTYDAVNKLFDDYYSEKTE
jgi:histone deacetylase complex regulatory component SIN3